MELVTRRMGTLLFFPFHLLAIAREPLGSLKIHILKEEIVLLATFATIVPLQPWEKMKSWKRNIMRRNLLSSPPIFHVCPVERNPHPRDSGTAFQSRKILGMVEVEIPGPLFDMARPEMKSGRLVQRPGIVGSRTMSAWTGSFWWLIELLVLVGEYVETCGHLIYACRQLKGSDLDLFRVWVGVWAGRLGGWAQVVSQFLSQGFYCGAGLFTPFLRLLGAVLLLILALFLGCLQLCW
jgi:hypothetical protein